jgi:hypothetical protein
MDLSNFDRHVEQHGLEEKKKIENVQFELVVLFRKPNNM